MEKFIKNVFSFSSTISEQDWLFNWKHLIIVFSVMAFVIFFCMLYYRKRKLRQKIFLILSGVFMLLLEGSRLLWNALVLKDAGIKLTFWNVTSLDLFSISVWFSAIFLFFAVGLGPKKRLSQLMFNFIFTVTAIVAIIDIVYPIGLQETVHMYHFANLQYLVSRALVLLVALFLGCTDWLDNSLDDIWMAILNLIFMIGLGVGLYYLSDKLIDVIYIQECPWLTMAGINVESPWHMLIVGLFFFGMQVIIYLPFDIYRKIKYKTWKPAKF